MEKKMNSNQEAYSNVMKFGGLQYHPSDCYCKECRNAISKELARVKISELNFLAAVKEVDGLSREKVWKNKVGR